MVFDRGYNDYTWFRQLCKSDVFLVTRLKSNARFRVIERHGTDRATGVISDHHIIQVAVGEKTMADLGQLQRHWRAVAAKIGNRINRV